MKVELHKLFYTPVWRFHYPDFENDHFDRYNFPNTEDMQLMEYGDE
jgi:hypothetical protein